MKSRPRILNLESGQGSSASLPLWCKGASIAGGAGCLSTGKGEEGSPAVKGPGLDNCSIGNRESSKVVTGNGESSKVVSEEWFQSGVRREQVAVAVQGVGCRGPCRGGACP